MEILLLQQYLPFTVLKHKSFLYGSACRTIALQQYLPFTVLKPEVAPIATSAVFLVATVLTVYGIETRLTSQK